MGILSLSLVFLLKFQNSGSQVMRKMISKVTPHPEKKKSPLFYRTIGSANSGQEAGRPTPSSKGRQTFTVELLVTTKKQRAKDVVQDLRVAGIKAFYTTFKSRGRVFYKVRSGLFRDTKKANQHKSRLARQNFHGKIRNL